ncbi:uncharacterized protein LOC129581532 [Paramacrobiotus metropolitanus]|uniref:uncharacterized protein LOC129581532 n=1 Tax=Paramacrobiotus metropolitanus TaxID=2943436 RepID=UPI002445710F|nr:uncharacterized protein LOC129581532 [Paramacrobiotus metropolitanus]
MAEEEDENVPKARKEKEKDQGPELAPGEVINPIEYKMFDPYNMQKSLAIPQKFVYSFQKELSGTLQKRLNAIRLRYGADDSKQVADKSEAMEIKAGLQPWEAVDPVSGQLLESIPMRKEPKATAVPVGTPGTGRAQPQITHITTSTLNTMRAGLPKAKMEDRNAMPAVNRRMTAAEPKFEGALKADEQFEYGDYYETMDKLDRQWRDMVGHRPSEIKTDKRSDATKLRDPGQKRKGSVAVAGEKYQPGKTGKAKLQRIGTGYPTALEGVINYFTETVSPDCNLESWLSPTTIVPVFRVKDVPPEIENTVVTIAKVTHSKFIDDQGIAMLLRSALEKFDSYACKWHVIVGRRFGLQINADKGCFLFMYIGHLGYVVFRTFG